MLTNEPEESCEPNGQSEPCIWREPKSKSAQQEGGSMSILDHFRHVRIVRPEWNQRVRKSAAVLVDGYWVSRGYYDQFVAPHRAGLCDVTMRAPGAVSSVWRCQLPEGHDPSDRHVWQPGVQTEQVFSTADAEASWARAPSVAEVTAWRQAH